MLIVSEQVCVCGPCCSHTPSRTLKHFLECSAALWTWCKPFYCSTRNSLRRHALLRANFSPQTWPDHYWSKQKHICIGNVFDLFRRRSIWVSHLHVCFCWEGRVHFIPNENWKALLVTTSQQEPPHGRTRFNPGRCIMSICHYRWYSIWKVQECFTSGLRMKINVSSLCFHSTTRRVIAEIREAKEEEWDECWEEEIRLCRPTRGAGLLNICVVSLRLRGMKGVVRKRKQIGLITKSGFVSVGVFRE